MVDVNNVLDGDGFFSLECFGFLLMNDFLEVCFSGKWIKCELYELIVGCGGMILYLGINSMFEVEVKV